MQQIESLSTTNFAQDYSVWTMTQSSFEQVANCHSGQAVLFPASLAGRAIDLMAQYLRTAAKATEIVLRIAPQNVRSIRVAEKAGFTRVGINEIAEGQQVWYVRKL